jgi:hypothetical protein
MSPHSLAVFVHDPKYSAPEPGVAGDGVEGERVAQGNRFGVEDKRQSGWCAAKTCTQRAERFGERPVVRSGSFVADVDIVRDRGRARGASRNSADDDKADTMCE